MSQPHCQNSRINDKPVSPRATRRIGYGLVAAIALAVCFSMTSTVRVVALPQYEVETFFYDESDELVGYRLLNCSGGKYEEGNPSLAQPGHFEQNKTACSPQTQPAFIFCWWTVDNEGHATLDYCT
jgi:hypothetical protein